MKPSFTAWVAGTNSEGLISDMLFPDCKNALISGGRDSGVGVAVEDGVEDGCAVIVATGIDVGLVGLEVEQLTNTKVITMRDESQTAFLPTILPISEDGVCIYSFISQTVLQNSSSYKTTFAKKVIQSKEHWNVHAYIASTPQRLAC